MRSNGRDRAEIAEAGHRLGVVVRARRRALRLNQAELADLAGVGVAFLYELEHGKATVRMDKVLAVFAVLGLELQVRAGKRLIASELPDEAPE